MKFPDGISDFDSLITRRFHFGEVPRFGSFGVVAVGLERLVVSESE